MSSKLAQWCLILAAVAGFVSQLNVTEILALPIPPTIAEWITLTISGAAAVGAVLTRVAGFLLTLKKDPNIYGK